MTIQTVQRLVVITSDSETTRNLALLAFPHLLREMTLPILRQRGDSDVAFEPRDVSFLQVQLYKLWVNCSRFETRKIEGYLSGDLKHLSEDLTDNSSGDSYAPLKQMMSSEQDFATDDECTLPLPLSFISSLSATTHPMYLVTDDTSPTDLPDETYLPTLYFKLKCYNGTTHCRIRNEPSLQSQEVGMLSTGCVVRVSGVVNGFFVLHDGRGYVKRSVDDALTWERLGAELPIPHTQCDALLSRVIEDRTRKIAHDLIFACLGSFREFAADLDLTSVDLFLLCKLSGLGEIEYSDGDRATEVVLRKALSSALDSNPASSFSQRILQLCTSQIGHMQRIFYSDRSNRLPAEAGEPTVVVVETEHPYSNNMDQSWKVSVPGAVGLEIVFDERSSTERNCDHLTFYSDGSLKQPISVQLSGSSWPGAAGAPPLVLAALDTCYARFQSDSNNTDWGFKFTASSYVPPFSPVELKYTYSASPPSSKQRLSSPSAKLAFELLSVLLESPSCVAHLFPTALGEEMIEKNRQIAKIITNFHPMVVNAFSGTVMSLMRFSCTTTNVTAHLLKSLSALASETIALSRHVSASQRQPNRKLPSPTYQAIAGAAVFCRLFIESRVAKLFPDISVQTTEECVFGPQFILPRPKSSDQKFARLTFTGSAAIGLFKGDRWLLKWCSSGEIGLPLAVSKCVAPFTSGDILGWRIKRYQPGTSRGSSCAIQPFVNGIPVDNAADELFTPYDDDLEIKFASFGASEVLFLDGNQMLWGGYVYSEDKSSGRSVMNQIDNKTEWEWSQDLARPDSLLRGGVNDYHDGDETESDYSDDNDDDDDSDDEEDDDFEEGSRVFIENSNRLDGNFLSQSECSIEENTPWPLSDSRRLSFVRVSDLCSITLQVVKLAENANSVSFGLVEMDEAGDKGRVGSFSYFGADNRSWGVIYGAERVAKNVISVPSSHSKEEIFSLLYDRKQGTLCITRADHEDFRHCLQVHPPNADLTLCFGALHNGGYEIKIFDQPFPETDLKAFNQLNTSMEGDIASHECPSFPCFGNSRSDTDDLPSAITRLMSTADIMLSMFDQKNWQLRRCHYMESQGFPEICSKLASVQDTLRVKEGERLDKSWSVTVPGAVGYYFELSLTSRLPTPIDFLSVTGDIAAMGWTLENALFNPSPRSSSHCRSSLEVGDTLVRIANPSMLGMILSLRGSDSTILCVNWLSSSSTDFIILPVPPSACLCRALASAGVRLHRKGCLRRSFVQGMKADIQLYLPPVPADLEVHMEVTPVLSRDVVFFDDAFASQRRDYSVKPDAPRIVSCLARFIEEVRKKHEWSWEDIHCMEFHQLWEDEEELSKFPSLKRYDLDTLSKYFETLLELDESLQWALGMIDLSLATHPNALAQLISLGRGMIFPSVKKDFIDRGMASSQDRGSKFQLAVSRSRASKYKQQGLCDEHGRWSIFGQVFRRVSSLPASALRRKDQLWETVLAGERAHDLGGPYREIWTIMCEELMSTTLPLFQLSPNGDVYVPNSHAKTPVQLQMFEFFGKIIGAAARGSLCMEISLASMVWRAILGLEPRISDWRGVDHAEYRTLECIRSMGRAEFESAFGVDELIFSSKTLAGNPIDLVEGGADRAVSWEERDEYFNLVLKSHMKEFDVAVARIRAGLATQLPPAVLSLITWRELEEMVCGRPEVNLSVLKGMATYSGYSPLDQQVQWLWEILEDFTTDERRAFLKFIWGRSRLPAKAAKSLEFKVQVLFKDMPDLFLPVAHTCFFSIDIPRYSNKHIMRSKLVYSMYNCVAIDADENDTGMRYSYYITTDLNV